MDEHATVFLSWNHLRGFLELVRDNQHRQIMKNKDIDYWHTVFVVCSSVAMNSYDLFGCRLSKDIHMPHFPPDVFLEEQSQTLLFPKTADDKGRGNPVLWHLRVMFEYMLGDRDERTVLLQSALHHIDSVITFQDDIDTCMEAFASCQPFSATPL